MTDNSRLTEEAREQLVELVAGALTERWPKSKIKRELIYEVFGKHTSRDTVERIMRDARALIRDATDVSIEDERSDAVAFLKTAIAEATDWKVKLEAQKQLAEMLGLGAKFGVQGDAAERAKRIRSALLGMELEDSEADVA